MTREERRDITIFNALLNRHKAALIDSNPATVKTYKAKLKHDNGIIYISTTATSAEDAINKIASAENCPASAVNIIYKN